MRDGGWGIGISTDFFELFQDFAGSAVTAYSN
jgi:hypothetical protein